MTKNHPAARHFFVFRLLLQYRSGGGPTTATLVLLLPPAAATRTTTTRTARKTTVTRATRRIIIPQSLLCSRGPISFSLQPLVEQSCCKGLRVESLEVVDSLPDTHKFDRQAQLIHNADHRAPCAARRCK